MFKPRVVIFTKLFWPEGGGAELATYTFVKEVLSRYFDVTVVSGTKNPCQNVLKNCRYIYWSVFGSKYKPIEWLKLFLSNRTVEKFVDGADIIYIPSHTLLPLAIALKKIKPTAKIVIHLHNYQPLTFTSVILATRGPDAVTDMVVELGEHESLLRALLSGFGHYANYLSRLSLLCADKIICVSRRQQEIVARNIPSIKDRVSVVYNPLLTMPNTEKKLEKTPTILYVGGTSYVKGFHEAIEVLTRVLAKYNLKAYITYERNVSTKQAQLLDKLSMMFGKKLIPLGRIPYEELIELHSRAWSLLFTSINEEPLPYAVMESMAAGTMPIASRVGGVAEIVEGTPAERFLCRPGDVDCFTKKIEEVASLKYEELIYTGLKLRKETMKRFSVANIEKKLVEILTSPSRANHA